MTSPEIDTARLTLALNEMRLPAIKVLWPRFTEQADKEGWDTARPLRALVEHELAERDRRRIERHLAQARLLPGKTLETFDCAAVPFVSKAHVGTITAGDSWIGKSDNILLFGPPGVGKSQVSIAQALFGACAIGTRSSWLRHRAGLGGERLPRALYPHHRSGSETPAGPP